MRKQLAMIMVLLITVFIGFGIIIPIMPEMVSTFHLAVMLAVYSAASFLMSPIWGALSDRIGRRPVIMVGILGFSISFFIFGIAGDQLWLMYASRILGGFFSGAVTACAVAYVADITSEDNRTKGMGLVGMSIGLGFIFGPAVGGLLSVYGNSVPFYASALLALVTFVFVAVNLSESLPLDKRIDRLVKRTSRWKAFQGAIKYLYVLGFFVSFTLAGLEATLQYFLIDRIGVTPSGMGIMFLVSGIVGAAIQGGVVRRYIKKGGEYKAIQAGLILSALGFFLILLSNQLWTATLYLSVFAAGNALIRPCVVSLITQKTTVGQGIATGLSSSMDSLGRIAGPLLGAAVFYLHMTLPFIVGGVLCVLALGLIYRFMDLDKKGLLSKSS
jgi:DHA1 family multidrug resistance protein-like MFS transporter